MRKPESIHSLARQAGTPAVAYVKDNDQKTGRTIQNGIMNWQHRHKKLGATDTLRTG